MRSLCKFDVPRKPLNMGLLPAASAEDSFERNMQLQGDDSEDEIKLSK